MGWILAVLLVGTAGLPALVRGADGDLAHQQTHFYKSFEAFLVAFENKEPTKFFGEAWALAEDAQRERYGTEAEIPEEKMFGVTQLTDDQRDSAGKAWQLLQKFVNLDESYGNGGETLLATTADEWMRAIGQSERFFLLTELKIVEGVKQRGEYNYLRFRSDLKGQLGISERKDSPKNTTIARAWGDMRSRFGDRFEKKLGEEKAEKFESALRAYFIDVAGAAIFARTEAAIQLGDQGLEEYALKLTRKLGLEQSRLTPDAQKQFDGFIRNGFQSKADMKNLGEFMEKNGEILTELQRVQITDEVLKGLRRPQR